MRVFTLYVGSKKPASREELVRILTEDFPAFTVVEGEGFFRGKPEPSWMIKIATDDSHKVVRAAAKIREALDQEGVGIEAEGEYYRCTEQACPEIVNKAERRDP